MDVTPPTQVQDDDVSTSGSDDDDEAMEASGMDAKIAAVLRATADAKESSRKAKEAMSQLRFRVRHEKTRLCSWRCAYALQWVSTFVSS